MESTDESAKEDTRFLSRRIVIGILLVFFGVLVIATVPFVILMIGGIAYFTESIGIILIDIGLLILTISLFKAGIMMKEMNGTARAALIISGAILVLAMIYITMSAINSFNYFMWYRYLHMYNAKCFISPTILAS